MANLIGSFVIVVIMTACLIWTRSSQKGYELSLPAGWLVPASDSTPESNCSPHENALAIYTGTMAAMAWNFPHTVIAYQGRPELVIDRNDKHEIAITVTVKGADGKIIATVVKNKFNLTQNALQTHEPRPDKSTLVVYDEYGTQVLNVRYLNPSAIRISGVLYYGGQRIDLPIKNFYSVCFEGNRTDINVQ